MIHMICVISVANCIYILNRHETQMPFRCFQTEELSSQLRIRFHPIIVPRFCISQFPLIQRIIYGIIPTKDGQSLAAKCLYTNIKIGFGDKIDYFMLKLKKFAFGINCMKRYSTIPAIFFSHLNQRYT